MSLHPFVSVIIPVRNDGDRLQMCLQALQQQTYPQNRFEIIVADNNSTEDLKAICQRFDQVHYTFEPKAGNNAARNREIAEAQGEIIAITDADCIPHPDWLSEGVRSIQMHPRVGIVEGRIEFFFEGDRPTPVEYADSICYLQQPVYVSRDHYAAGANLFTLRGVIETVGGFEERLLNLGDKEFGQRVYEAGWEVMYCPEAIVFHPARTTLQQLLEKTRRQTRANRVLCQLTGQKMLRCNFLPMGWQFFRAVWRDEKLLGLREKLALIWVMHRVKWAVAWEMLG